MYETDGAPAAASTDVDWPHGAGTRAQRAVTSTGSTWLAGLSRPLARTCLVAAGRSAPQCNSATAIVASAAAVVGDDDVDAAPAAAA